MRNSQFGRMHASSSPLRFFGLSCGALVSIFVVALVALVIVFASIYTSGTEYGECVGLGETQTESLVYEVDVGNVIIGIIGVETIIVPAYIVLKDLYCPTGVKPTT